jgi:hypothetical protein
MYSYESPIFINEGGEHTKETHCKKRYCYTQPCECGGNIHNELVDEQCTEDYSDCWDIYTWRCDKCNSTSPP